MSTPQSPEASSSLTTPEAPPAPVLQTRNNLYEIRCMIEKARWCWSRSTRFRLKKRPPLEFLWMSEALGEVVSLTDLMRTMEGNQHAKHLLHSWLARGEEIIRATTLVDPTQFHEVAQFLSLHVHLTQVHHKSLSVEHLDKVIGIHGRLWNHCKRQLTSLNSEEDRQETSESSRHPVDLATFSPYLAQLRRLKQLKKSICTSSPSIDRLVQKLDNKALELAGGAPRELPTVAQGSQ